MAKAQELTRLTPGNGPPAETRDAEQDDGSIIEYPSKAELTLITTALCLAVFLMALDQSIIATAIPRITDEFHSLGDVGWYGSAYLVSLPIFGNNSGIK